MSIRHYESITDIRRSLKKLAIGIKQNLKTIDTHKQGTKLAATLANSTGSKLTARIEARAIDMMSLERRTEALASLSTMDNTLSHLLSLIVNELPDEFIVQKLKKEIIDFRAQIAAANATSDYVTTVELPKEFSATYSKCVEWLGKNLKQYDLLSSRVILSADKQNLYFNGYIHIAELLDTAGYTYKDYYFIIRQSNKGKLSLGICHSFKPPESVNYIATNKPLAAINRNLTLNKIL